MQLNFAARFTTEKRVIHSGRHVKTQVLCFKHAVQAALKDEDVSIEVVDSDVDTYCDVCGETPLYVEPDIEALRRQR